MKHFVLLILFVSAAGFIQAQSLTPKTSYIGLSGDVSHYWLYNKKEFNAPDTAFGVKNDSVILNAYATGITFGHFFNSRFGLEANLNYSSQTQYYGHYPYEESNMHKWEAHTQLNYMRLPVKILLRKKVSEKSFFQYSFGVRLSYLTYAIDYSKVNMYPGEYALYIYENESYSHYVNIEGRPDEWVDIPDVHRDWRYHRLAFGLTAALQYEYFLTNRISIFGGVKFSADISNIDNTNALSYYQEEHEGYEYLKAIPSWDKYRYGYSGKSYDRSPSHNINAGLQAGIKFWFGENTLNIKVKKGRPLDW